MADDQVKRTSTCLTAPTKMRPWFRTAPPPPPPPPPDPVSAVCVRRALRTWRAVALRPAPPDGAAARAVVRAHADAGIAPGLWLLYVGMLALTSSRVRPPASLRRVSLRVHASIDCPATRTPSRSPGSRGLLSTHLRDRAIPAPGRTRRGLPALRFAPHVCRHRITSHPPAPPSTASARPVSISRYHTRDDRSTPPPAASPSTPARPAASPAHCPCRERLHPAYRRIPTQQPASAAAASLLRGPTWQETRRAGSAAPAKSQPRPPQATHPPTRPGAERHADIDSYDPAGPAGAAKRHAGDQVTRRPPLRYHLPGHTLHDPSAPPPQRSRSSRWSPTRMALAIAVRAGLTALMLG